MQPLDDESATLEGSGGASDPDILVNDPKKENSGGSGLGGEGNDSGAGGEPSTGGAPGGGGELNETGGKEDASGGAESDSGGTGGMPEEPNDIPFGCASFSAPERVANIGLSGDQYGPSLSADGLTLYFSSLALGSNSEVIYQATRPDRESPFGAPVVVPGINTTTSEGTPFINHAGTRLYFSRAMPGEVGTRRLYFADLDPTIGRFSASIELEELNSSMLDHLPWLSHDELTIHFASGRGFASSSIWTASRASLDEPFGAPTQLSTLGALTGTATSPSLTADGLTLYFSAVEAGSNTEEEDFWLATRASRDDDFGDVTFIADLSVDAASDLDFRPTAGSTEVFFSSDRQGGAYKIWVARALCP